MFNNYLYENQNKQVTMTGEGQGWAKEGTMIAGAQYVFFLLLIFFIN